MVNNKPGVLGVLHSTLKKLAKIPNGYEIYTGIINELIAKNFAAEIDDSIVEDHINEGKPVFYMAHQMVENPANKSTPIRCVSNSSQRYKGFSLNSSCHKGLDVVNNMMAIILRFREAEVASQGDVSKMFYQVRVKKEDRMMQLFLMKFLGEDKVCTFAMNVLIMGHKPSSNLAIIALKETGNLKDFPEKYPKARGALQEDSFVDNIFMLDNSIEDVLEGIKQVENISAQGGFKYKPWMISGQSQEDDTGEVKIMPHSPDGEDEKAVGLGWRILEDDINTAPGVNFSTKK